MEGQVGLLSKLLAINNLEIKLKSLKKEVEKEAPLLAADLIEKYGEGTVNALGHQIEVVIKTGRASLSWRKYIDWLAPSLKPSQRAKEKDFMKEPEPKPTIKVIKKL